MRQLASHRLLDIPPGPENPFQFDCRNVLILTLLLDPGNRGPSSAFELSKCTGHLEEHTLDLLRICGAKDRRLRPGLDALLKDAARGRFDVVLAWVAASAGHRHDDAGGPDDASALLPGPSPRGIGLKRCNAPLSPTPAPVGRPSSPRHDYGRIGGRYARRVGSQEV